MKVYRLQLSVYSLILCLLFTVICPLSTPSAHTFGQPPFFKINGQYANLYPVPLTSLYNFDLPQDLAPDNYLVNHSISFELDKGKLPAPPDIVEKTKFDWDFTDGSHGQGLKLTHTFTNIGSYIIKIYADDGITPKPQIIESVLVNVVPNNNYKLPQAKIMVEGRESKDPLTDILSLDFKGALSLDGSKSVSENSITEYFWDFGDQKSGVGPTQNHTYPTDLSQVFILLRVKDKNGFLADSFVEVQNSQNNQTNAATNPALTTPTPKLKKPSQLPFVLGLGILVITLIMVRWFVLGQRRGKHQ